MFIPSDYQRAIFSHVRESERSLLVSAVAGSGKTSTLIECLKFIPESERVVFLAFNKVIVEDLKKKVNGREIKTLNGLGFGMWMRHMEGQCKLMSKKMDKLWEEKIEKNVGKVVSRKLKWSVLRLVANAKMSLGVPKYSGLFGREVDRKFWLDLIDKLNIDCELNLREEFRLDFEVKSTIDALVYLSDRLLSLSVREKGVIDFDDQVYLPVVYGVENRVYDLVFVDETQDLNEVQRELVKLILKGSGKIVACGDFRQCQPPGTMVQVPEGGEVPIESLKDGDSVVVWDRHSQFLCGRKEAIYPIKVGSRHYEGELIEVSVESKSTKCTPNHKWITKWSKDVNKWAVYLMRRGSNFRVGWCQVFSNKGMFHLGHRTRLENADLVWILKVYDTKRDASLNENLISIEFGIPLVQFKQSIASPNAKLLDQEYLDEFWDKIGDNSENAAKCLIAFGRDPEFPLYVNDKSYTRVGRTTCMVTRACNLIEDFMNVPVTTEGRGIDWKPISLRREKYSGPVYSLDVEKHPYYVADGIVTHNSIYVFRNADVNSMRNFRDDFDCDELPLSMTYRCPKSVVRLAQEIVPEIECAEGAKEGVVRDAEYEREYKSGEVVLCRNNKPLMKLAFKLLRDGIPVNLSGNNLVGDLIKFIEDKNVKSLRELELRIDAWYIESTRLKLAKNKNADLSYFDDKKDVLKYFLSKARSIEDLLGILRRLAKSGENGVKLSTIHRFNGNEAEKVFVLDSDLIPSKYAVTNIAKEQEMNLKYVAITRTKNELNYINTPE